MTDELGPADDIKGNAQVMIYRWPNHTRLHIATTPGCFSGRPNMVWERRLSDNETMAMLENPLRVFDRVTPNGQVRITGGNHD